MTYMEVGNTETIHLSDKTSELENQAPSRDFFHNLFRPFRGASTGYARRDANNGEFRFSSDARYRASSYGTWSFQQRNKIRCHLKAKARRAAWWFLPPARS